MSIRVCVCYGQPTNPADFDEHYEKVHIPLAKAVPGLTDYTWGKVSSMDASDPPYFAIASLYFADEASMKSGLRSEEMKAAAADVANFATGGVTMFVQNEESVLS
ncbi:EthD family reductase [Gordonia sp. 852002-50395_SCH5434458]|uniref:EthD family reductase n=1 Tax=Gordonia sp. 852002-50395_SCH5434458 TaxID=1834090 RepID=UPI0007F8CD60|nr:EthD family reductase [Gordonia sp. 852002-50395_SCH5434458]OBB99577.1 ethyl tert-butyl ether degradation protein EthD [Gordonia sp. 852002-50395_SCH5434458]